MAQQLSTDCSCERLQVGSQQSHGGSQPFMKSRFRDLASSSDLCGLCMHMVYIHILSPKHIHIKKLIKYTFKKSSVGQVALSPSISMY